MARSYGGLWPQLVSWRNLLLAYRLCRRRKRYKSVATRFDYRWEENLLQLRGELRSGAYRPGGYRHFYIQEPKPRKISAAPFRDRVVHHAVVNVLEPVFERSFIEDSYACRRGKGTHRAIDRAQKFLRRFDYCLKTDIVRFFPNVDHECLLTLLRRKLRDKPLLALLEVILDSGADVLSEEATHTFFPGDDLFALARPKGLPIGNLTSQFLANVFLDPIDHYIKEELRVTGYVRYADDLLLFGQSKAELRDILVCLKERMGSQRLRLHANKTQIRPSRIGIDFLGFQLFPDGRRVNQAGLARFNRRLRRLKWLYARGEIDQDQVRASLQAWLAHVKNANSTGIRRQIWRRVRFSRKSNASSGPSRT